MAPKKKPRLLTTASSNGHPTQRQSGFPQAKPSKPCPSAERPLLVGESPERSDTSPSLPEDTSTTLPAPAASHNSPCLGKSNNKKRKKTHHHRTSTPSPPQDAPQTSSSDTTIPSGMPRKIVYCRVSSPAQRGDLERQVAAMRSQFPAHHVITDIGSGINFKRRGLLAILDVALRGGVDEVVVAHRDRLCRFAFDLVEWILNRHGARVVVAGGNQARPNSTGGDNRHSSKSEFVEDLLAIVHVFAARFHGLRRYERGLERDDEEQQEGQEGQEGQACGGGKRGKRKAGEQEETQKRPKRGRQAEKEGTDDVEA